MRAACLLLALSGCALLQPEYESGHAEIAAAFAPYATTPIAGEPAGIFMRRRTALLVSGVKTLRLNELRGAGGFDVEVVTDGEPPGAAIEGTFGGAAALSADGYFLTAAHCVEDEPIHLVLPLDGRLQSVPARVVWSEREPDVALLHAAVAPAAWFELLPDRVLAEGETLLGYCPIVGCTAGGMVEDVDLPAEGEYEALRLCCDVPARGGFSGGPAVSCDGALLGVFVTTGTNWFSERRSLIARVRPARLAQLIEEDRRALQGVSFVTLSAPAVVGDADSVRRHHALAGASR